MITYFLLSLALITSSCSKSNKVHYDVMVIGDGTGAISAAVQSSRSGARTLLLKQLPWLGGMLTSAGVSAIDGNHELPAGMWGEFRDSIYRRYGGPSSVATGWVSHTLFEPYIGNQIFYNIAQKEANLHVSDYSIIKRIYQEKDIWNIEIIDTGSQEKTITAKVMIDGSDLGDIAAMVNIPFDLGMEDQEDADELAGYVENDLIQDLTYVAILEKARDLQNQTLVSPSKNYDPQIFYCACEKLCTDEKEEPHPCDVMLDYAKLPNDKYLINWPIHGNDIYLNIVNDSEQVRAQKLALAKEKTLDFVHFLQKELGFSNLVLSRSEFPSEDHLPLMPYHREGRRIKGKVRFTSKHIKYPDHFKLSRTGIAVGDYPIDHHHKERKDIPELEYPIIPSYALPIGSLIPESVDNFLIADKAMSVSNIANGTTRLQPVILQVGQVAGIIAANAIKTNTSVHELDIRTIQGQILQNKGYISPIKDIKTDNPIFKAAQRIAACSLVDLEERPYKWANETLLHPDSLMSYNEVVKSLNNFYEASISERNEDLIQLSQLYTLLQSYKQFNASIEEVIAELEVVFKGNSFDKSSFVDRKIYIYLIDKYLDPFYEKVVDFQGEVITRG